MKTQNGLVSEDTSPFMLSCRDSVRLTPLLFLVELAEGFEPPTL